MDPARQPRSTPAEKAHGRGIIEVLDKHWTRAETDGVAARRTILLLSVLVVGLSMVVLSVAAAAAGFVVLVMSMHEIVGSGPSPLAGAMLAAAVASGVTVTVHGRRLRREQRP